MIAFSIQYYGRHFINIPVLICLVFVFAPSYQEVINCTINLDSQTYDLASLAQKPWRVKISEKEVKYATFSMCNRTYDNPCGATSVCIINEKNGTRYPAGDVMVVKPSTVKGRLSICFEGGDPSSKKTEIFFYCDDKIGQPSFIKFEDNTLYILWPSIAACPIKEPISHESCNFNLPGSIEYINLQPLRRKDYYLATFEGHKYYVNVCGGVIPSAICGQENVTVCGVISNSTTILGMVSKQQVATKSGLTIEYSTKSKTKRPTAIIEVVCNSTIENEQLRVKKVTNTTHIFELESPVGCVTSPVDCTAYGSNNLKYDLSSLRDTQRTVHDAIRGVQYKISVCRPLNLTDDRNCAGGVTVCLKNGNTSLSLGSLHDGPTVGDNQLSIIYSRGALCNSGNRYRSVINFLCAKTESVPKIESVSKDCVYTFIWYTPAACPTVSAKGENCLVPDPVMGYTFDLAPLRNLKNDYVMSNQDGEFRINVCGPLNNLCNGNSNASVCYTDVNGTNRAIGELAVAPHFDDGRLSFVLKGAPCESQVNSSTVHIIFNCAHGATNTLSHPEYLVKGENCNFYFLWQTNVTCADYKTFTCQFTDNKGQEYDLSPLSQPTYNYIVIQKGNKGGYKKYFINVCRSVLFGHDTRCRSQTGVCLYDLTQPNRQQSFSNLGEASEVKFDNTKNALQLVYENGDMCLDDKSREPNIKSVITFECDRSDQGNSSPILVNDRACVYEFNWKTKYACPKNDTGKPPSNNCTVQEFDFTPLAKEEHNIINKAGQKFHIVACGPLAYLNTTKGAGICFEKDNNYCENWGMGNANLIVDSGRVYLNYSGGVECLPNITMNTVIEFVCDEKSSGPQYIDSIPSNCTHVIHWFTELACKKNVPCIADGLTRQINLSLLINNVYNYNMSVNGSTFFINVCRPLVPIEGMSCAGGSAACKAEHEPKSKWKNEVSLGYPHFSPVVIQGKDVILKYFFGSRCPDKKYLNYSSSIVFVCDPHAGIGRPEFDKFTNDCQYMFSWKTSVICEDYETNIIDAIRNKTFTNPQNNMTIDLNPLCNKKDFRTGDFFLTMCDSTTLCSLHKTQGKSLVSYGTAQNVIFSYSENETQLFLTEGDECASKKSTNNTAVVHIRCSADEVGDHLSILNEFECRVEIVLRSKAGCFISVPPASSARDKVPTTKSHVSIAAVIFGLLFALLVCALVIYLRNPDNRSWCRSKLCNLLNRRHQGQFHYSMEDWSDS